MSGPGGQPWIAQVASLALLSARSTARARLVPALALVLVAAIAGLAATVTGDGSPQGRMQAFLSWSAGFTGLVVCLSAVFLGTRFGGGLRDGSLLQIATSPVPRASIPVAWWLGTTVVLGLLTCFAYAMIGAGAEVMRARAIPADRAGLSAPLSARGVARSRPPDEAVLAERVEQKFRSVLATGKLPEGLDAGEAVEQFERQMRLRLRTVPRGKSIQWTVDGVEPGRETDMIVLRFRFSAHHDGPTAQEGNLKIRGRFSFLIEGSQEPPAVLEGDWAPGEMHQLRAPAWVTGGSPQVNVVFEHIDPRPHVVVFPESGVQILYAAGSFWGNLIRSALVMIGRLAFLLAVGVVLASLLDPKLAALAVVFVFAVGAGEAFLASSLKPGLFGAIDAPLLALLRGVLWLLPNLGSPEVPALLAGGEQVGDAVLRRVVFGDGLFRSGLILAFGGALFARRELGAVR